MASYDVNFQGANYNRRCKKGDLKHLKGIPGI